MPDRILIENIIDQFAELHAGTPWMGDSFQKKINSITVREAFLKPLPTLHSAAQLIAHLTAWNNDAILKINTGTGVLRDNEGENWPDNELLKESGWEAILEAYHQSMDGVTRLLKTKDDSFLKMKYTDQDFKREYEYAFVVYGLLHHLVYHLGQLGIVIKLVKETDKGQ